MRLSGDKDGSQDHDQKKEEGRQVPPEVEASLEEAMAEYKRLFQRTDLDIFDEDQLNEFLETKVKPVLLKNATLADVNNIPAGVLEELYAAGFLSFKEGEYREAARIFTFLATQNHKDGRFSYSAGRCFENLGEYNLALVYYFSSVSADRLNPEYIFRLSYCLYIIGDESHAMDGFNIVIGLAESELQYKDIVEYSKSVVNIILSDKKPSRAAKKNNLNKKV